MFYRRFHKRRFIRLITLLLLIISVQSLYLAPTGTQAAATSTGAASRVLDSVACSEAALVTAINTGVSPINLPAGGCVITLTDDLPTITYTLVINGNGATIDGAGLYRPFYAEGGFTLTLRNLTVQNGYSSGSGGAIFIEDEITPLIIENSTFLGNTALYGGAILNYGPFTISDSTFSNNSAGMGGAIYNANLIQDPLSTATIINSTFSDNQASGGGGAILNEGVITSRCGLFPGDMLCNTLVISGSTFVNNYSGSGGNAGFGGGAIQNLTAYLEISSSTFSGNSTYQRGGAINNLGSNIRVSTSTFNGNQAGWGGAIASEGQWYESGGVIISITDIVNSSFSGNIADVGGAISNSQDIRVIASTIVNNSAVYNGGGLIDGGSSFRVMNSVIANNTAPGNGPDCFGDGGRTFIVQNSLIRSTVNCGVSDWGGNIFSQDPKLGPLADNGGPTQTHLPLLGSPAIDTAHGEICADTPLDQRGIARPYDGNGDGSSLCDMGAVERNTPVPTLDISDLTQVEGDSGSTLFIFTVTRSGSTDGSSKVSYTTADGTATTASGDYEAASGTITFINGISTRIIEVPVNGETRFEPDETFTVSLSNPEFATIGDGSAQGTITNDDPVPSLSISDATITEGDSGTANASFIVSLSNEGAPVVTVQYATADGTAIAGGDYTTASGTLTFNPGESLSQTVTVPVIGDTLDEAHETFTVVLSNSTNAPITDDQGLGTITDNDPAPTLSIDDVTLAEGDSGTTNAVFTVSMSAVSGQVVTVQYTSADGTAVAGSDYSTTAGTLTFNPGESITQTIHVPVICETMDEPDETFTLTLSSPANATLLDDQGLGTITDNDPAPTLSINDVTITEGNSGTVNASFTAALSAASGKTITVNYASADGTAAASDYTAVSGTLTFNPGASLTQTIHVPVIGDVLDEIDETFTVTLSSPTNATLLDDQGLGTITDDDLPPSLSVNDVTVTEGDSGTVNAVFTVTLSAASSKIATVQYATADGTAVAGSDYTTTSGTLTFNPGASLTQTIPVPVIGDTADEPDETFTLSLSSPANATLGDNQGVGTITDDDPTPFCALVTQIPRAECEALEAIYNSTGGPNWVRKTGWFTTYTPCSWQDIYCTGGHVRYLGLGQNNLNGTLPPEIGNLSALTNLDFNNNVLLTGGIPPEIGSLTNLKRLIFYNTSVGGSIPPEIGLLVNVEDLSLQRCNLTGELPPELGNLTHVVNLGLGNNYLTGTIPPELGNLPVVREIHLSLNQLTGEVPAALMSAPELRAFNINDNRLSASDPVVRAWLDIVSEEWEIQTVPPENIHSAYAGDTSIYPGWTPIPYTANGGYYEVVYSATSGGPYTAGCTTANKLANTCGVSGLTPNTPYYFVVRTFTPAHDLQLNDLWSTPSSEIMISTVIRDIAHPAAPTLSAPADRSNTTDTTPLLKWSKPTGATQYRLQVDDDPAFGSPANMGTDTILTTSYTVPTLNALPYGQYYWRVQAGNAANAWGDWSLIRRFTITLLKSPANATHLTDTTPTLSWTKPTGATAFEFKLDDSDSPVVMPFNTGLLTSYTPALLPNGEYWWSVRVLVGGTWSEWMPAWTFTITAPPTIKPALLTPLNGAIWPDLTPIFTWSSVAGGDHYQIQIDETSSFSSPVQDVTLGEGILTYTATPLLDGGKYFWRVRAINGTGVAGAWSGSYNFTLAQLSAPVLTSPLNKSAAQDRTPTFAWNVLVGAASYQIQISSDPNFVTVTHQGDTGTNGYTLPDLNALPDGVYTWRVRAINGLIIPGKWSSKWALIIDNTGPAAPVLSSPAFNSGTPDTTPTFTWKAPKDGKTYRIQVTGENDPTFAAMVINEPIPVTTFTPGTALDFDDYLWRVQALDVLSNAGDFSPVSRFDLTLHKAPADGAASTVTQPTFIWNALTGATAYDFELATDAEFTDVIYPYNGPNKSFKPTAVLEQGTYYWHVKTDISGWMPAWTIIITPPLPAKPVLAAPASKVLLNDNTPTLSWNAVTGITKYQIQVDNNTDFSSPAQDVIVSNLLNYIASELPDGTYTWRVRAINGVDAAGAWSSAFSLTIDTTPPAVPVVTAPVDNTSMTNTRFSLAWNKVNDAARYEVQIDLNLAFLLPLSDVGNKTSYKPATPLARGIYVWHVRAVDKAGNASGWSPARSFEIVAGVTSVDPTPTPTLEITPTDVPVEPTLEPTLAPTATLEPTLIPPDVPLYTLESDDPAVAQTGLWTVYDTPYASGGRYLYSSGSLDDALTLHFSGVQLDVIFVKHPALGQFVVEVDGAPLLLMNSYAPEAEFGVQASISLSAGEHIARLYPLSGTIAIDAFTVHSRIIPPAEPTLIPTLIPTFEPTVIPPELPTIVPPVEPTLIPTLIPTEIPTEIPTLVPTDIPTLEPTLVPTEVPTEQPPIEPTSVPVEPERTTT